MAWSTRRSAQFTSERGVSGLVVGVILFVVGQRAWIADISRKVWGTNYVLHWDGLWSVHSKSFPLSERRRDSSSAGFLHESDRHMESSQGPLHHPSARRETTVQDASRTVRCLPMEIVSRCQEETSEYQRSQSASFSGFERQVGNVRRRRTLKMLMYL